MTPCADSQGQGGAKRHDPFASHFQIPPKTRLLTGRFDAADPGVCIDSVFWPGNDSRILAEAILWGHRANVRVSWSQGRRKVAFSAPQARQVHRNSFGTIWTRLGKENFAGRGALSITV